jgi:hypothetical protein
VAYPSGLTPAEISRLDEWTQPNFREFCYMDKYGMVACQMLKAKGVRVPFVPAPVWYQGPELADHKEDPATQVQNAISMPLREEVPAFAQPEAESLLRQALTENGIEDLRAAPRSGSDSDSDLSVTPAIDSMRVGG